MKENEDLIAENAALRERLSKFAETGIRINESLQFDAVLQGVLDSARALTDARFGVIALQAEEGAEADYISSGMTAEETGRLWEIREGEQIFDHLQAFQAPTRLKDLRSYFESAGFDHLGLPAPHGVPFSFLAVPVRHMGRRVGSIFLAAKESAPDFTPEDEETLEMFASQAALVIANARTYRAERRARADLETLINISPVGVVVIDVKTGAPVSFNREARRIVENLLSPGESPQDVLDTITFVRSDGREISINEISMSELLSSGETVRVEEVVLKVPDGRSVSTLINATPTRAADGTVESCVVTMQDLTPIQNLQRMRAEFLGIVSHELRAPLTAVKGSATTLIQAIDDLEPPEMLQFFKIIDDQTDRMRDLIGELLQVARIETGTLSVRPEPLEPTDLIDEAKKRFLSAGGRDNVVIALSPQLPRVMADRRRIVQVLNNLLSNAEKFSLQSSPIRIEVVRKDLYVEISVADSGIGISTDALPHLFSNLARRGTTQDHGDIGASGLGLPICKGIVEAHGGRVWANSEGPGRGSKFSFTLLAFEGATMAASVPLVDPSPHVDQDTSDEEMTRILVIDDDPLVLKQVRNTLQKAGYAPVVTGDPAEVPKLILENEPGLILLDLLLPGIDGIELMGRISAIVDVPVVFLSAYRQDEVVTKAFESGAVDYIVKPFSESELIARIGAALRKPAVWRRPQPPEPYFRSGLSIDFDSQEVTNLGRRVDLTVTESKLLFELAANAGRVLTYDDLLLRIWPTKKEPDRGLVRTVVKRLRQKLGDAPKQPQHIFTSAGIGYRMIKPESNNDGNAD
ncbi:MAG: response regulator [Chloroflexi bacterium]|nr:response regulator [Chloroflexota bacterium]